MDNNISVCIIDDDDVFQYTILHTLEAQPSVGKITEFAEGSVDLVDFEKTKKISEVSDYIIKPIRENQLTKILSEIKN